jgi:hypothetical protein
MRQKRRQRDLVNVAAVSFIVGACMVLLAGMGGSYLKKKGEGK